MGDIMQNSQVVLNGSQDSVLATNKLIKNTYMLLSMTLFFSALMAALSAYLNVPYMGGLVCSILGMVMIWFVLPKFANSAAGIPVVFAVTGLFGFGIGPIINHYLAFSNGSSIVGTAMVGTGIIFVTLSAYALMTRKNFNFLGGFLAVGFIAVLVAALANIFLQMPAFSMMISAVVIMLMSGFILYDTSRMVNEPHSSNYIVMTISLYLSILNIFTSLLHLLGMGGDD